MAMRAPCNGKGGTTMVKLTPCWLNANDGIVPACPREECARRL